MLKPAMVVMVFAGLILSACGKPIVKHEPKAGRNVGQYKVLGWDAWDRLGERAVNRMIADLSMAPELEVTVIEPDPEAGLEGSVLSSRPFYVQPGPVDMPFSRAFKRILEEHILAKGLPVVTSPEDAIVVNYQVQSFLYDEDGFRLPANANTIVGIATAVGIEEYGSWNLLSSVAAGFAAAALVQPLLDYGAVTDAEMVMTLAVAHGPGILHQRTEAVYVRPEELPLYMTSQIAERPIRATTAASGDTLPVRTIAIVTQ